jgi:hypothetical protein
MDDHTVWADIVAAAKLMRKGQSLDLDGYPKRLRRVIEETARCLAATDEDLEDLALLGA